MTNFDDTLTINTVFGMAKIEYVAESTLEELFKPTRIVASHYVATMVDGDYNGWHRNSVGNHGNALSALMSAVATRYGYDLATK